MMGTDAQVLMRLDEAAAQVHFDAAEAELQRLCDVLTRFDPGSELERMNDAGGGRVGPELLELLEQSLRSFEATEGRFDVGVGAHLLAAGYDRTYDDLAHLDDDEREQLVRSATHEAGARGSIEASRVAPFTLRDGEVTLRAGIRVDLGGIAKGWSADRVARELHASTGASTLVSLGGDIAVQVSEGDRPWPIAVETGSEGSITLALAHGGLATSGWQGRMWRTGADGEVGHHLIDPATGRPARSDVARITVIADTCMDAEVWTTALMLAGADAAALEARERELTAIIVRSDGSHVRTGALAG